VSNPSRAAELVAQAHTPPQLEACKRLCVGVSCRAQAPLGEGVSDGREVSLFGGHAPTIMVPKAKTGKKENGNS
jgi:hypothetical protein